MTDPSVLGIVPARGGSKGLTRKNLQPIGGRPLLAHTLAAAEESGAFDRLVVSSEDEEILRWSDLHGYETLHRKPELASDDATIADVAAAVADELEWSDTVVVLQPTSPLRTAASIRAALAHFTSTCADSLITVTREPHLYWFDEGDDLSQARPLFSDRLNRQYGRHRVLRESGAIQIVRAEILRSNRTMIGARHQLYELSADEGIDIDTIDDLAAARRLVEQGNVIFRLRANRRAGSGHLYHCLQLAEELADQRISFLLSDSEEFAGEIIAARGYRHRHETDMVADLEVLRGPGPNLVVNDVLDTDERDLLAQRSMGFKVVTIEDLGAGPRFADWVVNALYPIVPSPTGNMSTGSPWAPLRTEFWNLPPKQVRERAQRVLLTFGGTDPAHLSRRLTQALVEAVDDLEIVVVLGPGVPDQEFPAGVEVRRTVKSMAAEMLDADLVITSAGRTVYEAAVTGTPIVVVAQNAREATHTHLGYDTGVVFLGVGPLVDDDHFISVVKRLLADVDLRTELSTRLRKSVDTRGSERIGHRIRAMLKDLDE